MLQSCCIYGFQLTSLPKDYIADAVDVGGAETGIERESQDAIGNVRGDRGRGGIEAGAAAVAGKGIGDGVEVLSRDNAVLVQAGVDFITVILVAVEHDGEIGIVRADAFLRRVETDAGHAVKALPIALICKLALGDPAVEMTQVAQPHRRAELVHLRVAADVLDVLRPLNTEVLEVVDALRQSCVLEAERAALNGVEDLGGMEGEHGSVAEAGGADAVFRHAESMGGVIDDL